MVSSLINNKLVFMVILLFVILGMISCDEENAGPVGEVEGVVMYEGTTIPVPAVNIEIDILTTMLRSSNITK